MEIAPVGIQMTYANANNAGQVQHNMNHAIAVQQDTEAAKQKEDAELKQAQVAAAVTITIAQKNASRLRTMRRRILQWIPSADIFWIFLCEMSPRRFSRGNLKAGH